LVADDPEDISNVGDFSGCKGLENEIFMFSKNNGKKERG
jgi:hypothetical protein